MKNLLLLVEKQRTLFLALPNKSIKNLKLDGSTPLRGFKCNSSLRSPKDEVKFSLCSRKIKIDKSRIKDILSIERTNYKVKIISKGKSGKSKTKTLYVYSIGYVISEPIIVSKEKVIDNNNGYYEIGNKWYNKNRYHRVSSSRLNRLLDKANIYTFGKRGTKIKSEIWENTDDLR